MSKLKKVLPLAIGALFLAASAQATTIDFTGLHGVTDPVVGPVSFWAGDPLVPNDTLVDDSVTPLNDYLMSGYADGTGNSPAAGYDTFIGVSKTGVAFGSASFDIASEYSFPMGGATPRSGLRPTLRARWSAATRWWPATPTIRISP